MINTSSLEKAIASLDEILAQPMNPFIRDGAIQRFEYTFELCWRMMARVLKERGVEAGSPKLIFREAAKDGLISDIEPWLEFLKSRNLVTHTYNEDVAIEVFNQAKRFPEFAKEALKRVKENA